MRVERRAAYGTAILADIGASVYGLMEEAYAHVIRKDQSIAPSASVHAYDEYYFIYRAVYPAPSPYFKHINAVAAKYS